MKAKRFLALFLALCMVLTLVPSSAYASSVGVAGDTMDLQDETNEEEASSEEVVQEIVLEETTENSQIDSEQELQDSIQDTEEISDVPEQNPKEIVPEVSAEEQKSEVPDRSDDMNDNMVQDQTNGNAATEEIPADGIVTDVYQEMKLGDEYQVYGQYRENKFIYRAEEDGWYRIDIDANGSQYLYLYEYTESGLNYKNSIDFSYNAAGTRAMFAYLKQGQSYIIEYSSYYLSSIVLNELQTIADIRVKKQSDTQNKIHSNANYDMNLDNLILNITYEDENFAPEEFEVSGYKNGKIKFAGINGNLNFEYQGGKGSWYEIQPLLCADAEGAIISESGIVIANATLDDTDIYAGEIVGIEVRYAYDSGKITPVEKIEVIQAPARTEYYANSDIDLDISDLVTRITYDDGETIDVTGEGYSYGGKYQYDIDVNGFSTSQAGEQTISVKDYYSNALDEFTITILPNPFNHLEVVSTPVKTEYCDNIYEYPSYQGLVLELSNTENMDTVQLSYDAEGRLYDETYGRITVTYPGFDNVAYLAASDTPYTATVSTMGLNATYPIYVRTMDQLAANKMLTTGNPVTYLADALGSEISAYYKFEVTEDGTYNFSLSSQNGYNGNVCFEMFEYHEADGSFSNICGNWLDRDQALSLNAGTYYIRLYSNGSKGCTFQLNAALQSGIQSFEIEPDYTDYWDLIDDVSYATLVNDIKIKLLNEDDEMTTIYLYQQNYSVSILADGTTLVSFDNGFTMSFDADNSYYFTPGKYEISIGYGNIKRSYEINVHNPKTEALVLTAGEPQIVESKNSTYKSQIFKYIPNQTGYYNMNISDDYGNSNYYRWYNSKFMDQGGGDGLSINLQAGKTYYFSIANSSYSDTSTATIIELGQLTGLSLERQKDKYVIGEDDLDYFACLLSGIRATLTFANGTTRTYDLDCFNNYEIDTNQKTVTFYYQGFATTTPYYEGGIPKGNHTINVEYEGMTASFEAIVLDIGDLAVKLGMESREDIKLDEDEEQYYYYSFTPDESGYYSFNLFQGEEDYEFYSYLYLFDDSKLSNLISYTSFYDVSTSFKNYMESGKTYYLKVLGNSYWNDITLHLTLSKTQIPDSISIVTLPSRTMVWETNSIEASDLLDGLKIAAQYGDDTEYVYMNMSSVRVVDGVVTVTGGNGLKASFAADIEDAYDDLPVGEYDVTVDYLGATASYSVSIKHLGEVAVTMTDEPVITSFTADEQSDYFLIVPEESGYYKLNTVVTAANISDYHRNVDIYLYNKDYSKIGNIYTYVDGEDDTATRFLTCFLEAGEAYYIKSESEGDIGGNLQLYIEKQAAAESIVVESIPPKLVGSNTDYLMNGIRLKVIFAEGVEEIYTCERQTSSNYKYHGDMVTLTYIYEPGIEVKYTVSESEEYDGLNRGDIEVDISYLGETCLLTVPIRNLSEWAEEFTSDISIVSSGSFSDYYYYKFTASSSGMYIMNIPDQVYVDIPNDSWFEDYDTYSYCNYSFNAKAGETYYFRVKDSLSAGTPYTITLQNREDIYQNFSGSETIVSDGNGDSTRYYYKFTPTASGLYEIELPVDEDAYIQWYTNDFSDSRYYNESFIRELTAGQTYYFEIYDYYEAGHQYTVSLKSYTIPKDVSYSLRKQWIYEVNRPSRYCLDCNVYVDGKMLDYTEVQYSNGVMTYYCDYNGIRVSFRPVLDKDGYLKPGTYAVQIYYFNQFIAEDSFEVVSLADISQKLSLGESVKLENTKSYEDYYFSFTPSEAGYYKFSAGASSVIDEDFNVTMYADESSTQDGDYLNLKAGTKYYFVFYGYQSGTYNISITKLKEAKSLEILEKPTDGVENIYGYNPYSFADGLKVKINAEDGSSKTVSVDAYDYDWDEDEQGRDLFVLKCRDGIDVKYCSNSYYAKAGIYTVIVSYLNQSTTFTRKILALDEMAESYVAGMEKAVTYNVAGSYYEFYRFIPVKTDIYTVALNREIKNWSGSIGQSNRYYFAEADEEEDEAYWDYNSFYNGSTLRLEAGEEYYFVLYTNTGGSTVNLTFSLQGRQQLFSDISKVKDPVKTSYSQLSNAIDLNGIEIACKYTENGDTFTISAEQLTGLTTPGSTTIIYDTAGNTIEAHVDFKYKTLFNSIHYPTAGINAIMLTIGSHTLEIPIEVQETPLQSLEIITASDYEYGETTAMLTDTKVEMVFNSNGTAETKVIDMATLIAAKDSYDAGYGSYPIDVTFTQNLENAGTKSFSVAYMGKKATGEVIVNKKKIDKIDVIGVKQPVLGEEPNQMAETADSGYTVTSVVWKDADGNTMKEGDVFSGATRYTAYVTVKPADDNHRFTTSTNATIDGKTATSKTSNANGTYTVSYKYGYTDCKITLPEDNEGRYTFSGKSSVEYKGSYTFTLTLDENYSRAGATVKANASVLKESTVNGTTYTYVLNGVFSNQTITIKDLVENTEGINVKFYDDTFKSAGANTLVDQLTVNSGHSIRENVAPENEMPQLEDVEIANGSESIEMMFYGWYKDINKEDTRIKSSTIITLDMADTVILEGKAVNVLNLSPRFIQKTFRYEYNGVWVVYKILSISEDGKIKLQVYNTNVDQVPASQVLIAADQIPGIEAVKNGNNVEVSLESFSYQLADGISAECDITEIAEGAFSGAGNITAIKLPNTIETIEQGAFAGCTSLETINIPENITSIPAGTFQGCSSLKEVVLPEALEMIDPNAFDTNAGGITLTCAASVCDLVRNSVGDGFTIKSILIDFTNYDYSSMSLAYGQTAQLNVSISVNGSKLEESVWDAVTVSSLDKEAVSVSRNGSVLELEVQKVSENTVMVEINYDGVGKRLAIDTEKAKIELPVVNREQNIVYNTLDQTFVIPEGNGYTVTGNTGRNAGGYTAVITPQEYYQWEDGTTAAHYITWCIEKAHPTYHVPSGLTGIVGKSLSSIQLPTGYTWEDPTEIISKTGINSYEAIYDSGDSNYMVPTVTLAVTGISQISSIKLNKASAVMTIGDKLTLTTAITPDDADSKNISWTSSKPAVAKVEGGLVTALSAGTTDITVTTTDGSNIKVTCTITVKPAIIPVSSISLNKKDLTLTKGKSETLNATILPSNATDRTIIWSTNDVKVAKVENGKVTAVGVGTTIVTAKAGTASAACSITVGYGIFYKLNGGKNHTKNPDSYYNQNVSLKNPTKAGYTFGGWYTDKNLKKKITSISKSAKQDYTLYAKWTKVTVAQNKITSAKNNTSKKALIKFSKVNNAQKYEISYSTSNSFKKADTRTVTSTKTSVTLSQLAKGKTYYVRVRAYSTDSTGGKVYGKWSKVQKVKITK